MKNQELSLVADFGYFFDFCFKKRDRFGRGGVIQVISGSAVLHWAYNYLLGVNNHRSNFLIFFTLKFFFDFLTSNELQVSQKAKKIFCIKITGFRVLKLLIYSSKRVHPCVACPLTPSLSLALVSSGWS